METNILGHSNRLDYGAALMPEEGWSTSWAIGTTYSLHLDILLSIPLALFHRKYHSESTTEANLRTDMLDALNKVRDKMFIFVHPNNIKAQCGYSMLMGFLDQNIWNFDIDKNCSFHPKVWLIRYEKEDDKAFKYRLIVMSRNITSATDFDIAVTMDSMQLDNRGDQNDALITMMTNLMKASKRRDIIKQLEELRQIKFIPPAPFDRNQKGAEFSHSYPEPISSPFYDDRKFSELLVISPFVDDDALELLKSKCNGSKPVLISRGTEMSKCSPEILQNWECYEWNPILDNARDYEEMEAGEDDTSSRSIGLHAKIYIAKTRYPRERHEYNHWFIGSTNCTGAGIKRNYEALVHLCSNSPGTSAADVLNTFLNENAPLATAYSIHTSKTEDLEKDKNIKRELKHRLYTLLSKKTDVQIKKDKDGKFSTSLKCDSTEWKVFNDYWGKCSNVNIEICPFANESDHKNLAVGPDFSFSPIYCQQLSQFLKVKITYSEDSEEFLCRLDFTIPEERHQKIMSEILDNEEKIMRYLMFCIDNHIDKEQQMIGRASLSKSATSYARGEWSQYSLPIYEKLLLAASRKPEGLRDIKRFVERLKNEKDSTGKPLLSKDFLRMWNIFKEYTQ